MSIIKPPSLSSPRLTQWRLLSEYLGLLLWQLRMLFTFHSLPCITSNNMIQPSQEKEILNTRISTLAWNSVNRSFSYLFQIKMISRKIFSPHSSVSKLLILMFKICCTRYWWSEQNIHLFRFACCLSQICHDLDIMEIRDLEEYEYYYVFIFIPRWNIYWGNLEDDLLHQILFYFLKYWDQDPLISLNWCKLSVKCKRMSACVILRITEPIDVE